MGNNTNPSYFLGANTPQGFFSCFNDPIDIEDTKEVYIIKGGPGTGKSSFMRRIAQSCIAKGLGAEFIYCSSDPDSLDGIVIPEIGAALLDGTSPHVLEPRHPGADGKILNLGEFWNEEGIKSHTNEILSISASMHEKYQNVYRLLFAASSLMKDAHSISGKYTLLAKMSAAADRIIKAQIKPIDRQGKMKRRFITGITPQNIKDFFTPVYNKYEKVYNITDEYGISGIMLARIQHAALSSGHDVISCPCPMDPQGNPQHLLIPTANVAFITTNKYHSYKPEPYKTINMNRFIDVEGVMNKKIKLHFDEKVASQLIEEACQILHNIKSEHDELEKCYTPYMDFESVNKLADNIADEICTKI